MIVAVTVLIDNLISLAVKEQWNSFTARGEELSGIGMFLL